MSVGLLLVTHGKLGHFLLECVQEIIGPLPMAAEVLEVPRVQSHDQLIVQGRQMLARLDGGKGALILTDAFGSTPSNIANKLGDVTATPVIAGLNLPMLVRVFNYPQASSEALVEIAVQGGQRGVFRCPRNGDSNQGQAGAA
ncbi:MAG: PTS sugar transporter subunit IIA [Panacagrimonas sp.]